MPSKAYATPSCLADHLQFDPQTQPLVDLQAAEALHARSLELGFIQHAFERGVRWQVEPLFAQLFPNDTSAQAALRHAAVFMPFVQRANGLNLLFTRRADHLHDHAGQICFPGGRIEAFDTDEVAAALRETHEEIGVEPEYVQLLGTQPGFITTTRFVMTPVLGVLKSGFTITPDTSEVAEVFEVPLSALMDPARHHLHQASLPGGTQRFYFSMTWGRYFIWGATAALIRNLYRFLAAAQVDDASGR